MRDRGAKLRFYVVSNDRKISRLEPIRELFVAGDEYRHVVDEGNAGFQCAFRVKARSLLRSDGDIIEQNFGTAIFQFAHDFRLRQFRCTGADEGPVLGIVRHMFGNAVEHRSHAHDHVTRGNVSLKNLGAVRLGKNRLVHIHADFAGIDIESGNHLDVTRQVAADLGVHQTGNPSATTLWGVIMNSLDKRAGAVSYPCNRDSDATLRCHGLPL